MEKLLIVIIVLAYIIFDFIRNKKTNIFKRLIMYSFVFYSLSVLRIVTGSLYYGLMDEQYFRIQFIPFGFIIDWVRLYQFYGFDWFFWNSVKLVFYNVIMLLPLGIYLPLLFNVKSIKKVGLYIMLISLAIEIYQLIFTYLGIINRTANIDDVILNTLGGIIGFMLYRIIPGGWIDKFS